MYDNKIRLSQDVLDKAEVIAQEWGLKNARAAVEAVFRRYADEYLGRQAERGTIARSQSNHLPIQSNTIGTSYQSVTNFPSSNCDAINELDDLLGL